MKGVIVGQREDRKYRLFKKLVFMGLVVDRVIVRGQVESFVIEFFSNIGFFL